MNASLNPYAINYEMLFFVPLLSHCCHCPHSKPEPEAPPSASACSKPVLLTVPTPGSVCTDIECFFIIKYSIASYFRLFVLVCKSPTIWWSSVFPHMISPLPFFIQHVSSAWIVLLNSCIFKTIRPVPFSSGSYSRSPQMRLASLFLHSQY